MRAVLWTVLAAAVLAVLVLQLIIDAIECRNAGGVLVASAIGYSCVALQPVK